jgi:uncharacterized protein YdbL (DUF1318 family)
MFRPPYVIAVAAAAVATVAVAAAPVLAQTAAQKARIDAAKAAGVVGEQADGFLGFRLNSDDAELREAVRLTNAARGEVYARSAEAAGTTAAVAGARMFELNLLPRLAPGEWYRNAQGQWVQR